MNYSHEIIMPNDDIPFKMFVFEERAVITRERSTGIVLSKSLLCSKERLNFT